MNLLPILARSVRLVMVIVASGFCSPLCGQQSVVIAGDGTFRQMDPYIAAAARVRAACPAEQRANPGALLKEHDSLAAVASRASSNSFQLWISLACTRALLFAADLPAGESFQMPPGTSWAAGATTAVLKAIELRPRDDQAIRLLAILGVARAPTYFPAHRETDGHEPAHGGDAAASGTQAGVQRNAELVYGAVMHGARDPVVMRACTSLMIDAHDALAAHDCSMLALDAGADSTWHLLRLAWLAVLRNDANTAVTAFSAAVVAARDPASRAEVGWHLEQGCTLGSNCPDRGVIGRRMTAAERERWLAMPDSDRMQWILDELTRIAPGDTTAAWREGAGLAPETTRAAIRSVLRESPLMRHLVRHLWSISYGGGTFRACDNMVNHFACPEMIAPLGDQAIGVVAQLEHLWDPASGAPMDVVPYTVIANDVVTRDSGGVRRARLTLRLHRWDLGQSVAVDTAVALQVQIPPKTPAHPAFTGFLIVPGRRALRAWSLMATQDEPRHGQAISDSSTPLESGPIAISDLVFGTESDTLRWPSVAGPVFLAPQRVVDRSRTIHLYFQVHADEPHGEAKTTIAILPVTDDDTRPVPAMTIGFVGPLGAGINEVSRQLDARNLKEGRYYVDVRIVIGGVETSRRAIIFLR